MSNWFTKRLLMSFGKSGHNSKDKTRVAAIVSICSVTRDNNLQNIRTGYLVFILNFRISDVKIVNNN